MRTRGSSEVMMSPWASLRGGELAVVETDEDWIVSTAERAAVAVVIRNGFVGQAAAVRA